MYSDEEYSYKYSDRPTIVRPSSIWTVSVSIAMMCVSQPCSLDWNWFAGADGGNSGGNSGCGNI